MGFGEYHAGEWCRFCRANGMCKAQANQHISAFDDFKDCVAGHNVAILSPEEVGIVLSQGEDLVTWYEAVKKRALEVMLNGESIPGYKVVEGRSSRCWTDQDAALDKLQESGVDRALIYDSVPKTLAQLEKMLGTVKFKELVGEFVTKPQGKLPSPLRVIPDSHSAARRPTSPASPRVARNKYPATAIAVEAGWSRGTDILNDIKVTGASSV